MGQLLTLYEALQRLDFLAVLASWSQGLLFLDFELLDLIFGPLLVFFEGIIFLW